MESTQSPYYTLSYDAEKRTVIFKGLLASDDQSEEDFKEISLQTAAFVEHHQPDFFLSDLRDYRFVVTPSLQEWAVKNSSSRITKTRVKKLAIVVSESFITQLSVEQHADEATKSRNELGKPLRYFTSIEEAEAWFLEASPAAQV